MNLVKLTYLNGFRSNSWNTMLNVGIIGCGHIADSHINAWKGAGARVVAVCDKNMAIARTKAVKWGISQIYEDASQMVKEESLNVVSICTPANVRLGVVKPIMEKGVHVVIEKPFAMSVDEAEKMTELAKENGVKLTVVHNWLFSHIMKKTLSSLKRKEIGDLLGLKIDLLHTKDDQMAADSSHWCHSLEAGRFGEMLPHPLYIIRAILGDIKVKYISGSKLGCYSWMPIDELRVLFEDIRGRMAQIYVSFNTARPETTLKIFGTTGILEVNLSNNIFIKKRYRDITITQVIKDNLHFLADYIISCFSIASAILAKKYQDMHTEFMKDFVKSLINNTEPPVTAEEALEVTRLHKELCSKIDKRYFTT